MLFSGNVPTARETRTPITPDSKRHTRETARGFPQASISKIQKTRACRGREDRRLLHMQESALPARHPKTEPFHAPARRGMRTIYIHPIEEEKRGTRCRISAPYVQS